MKEAGEAWATGLQINGRKEMRIWRDRGGRRGMGIAHWAIGLKWNSRDEMKT